MTPFEVLDKAQNDASEAVLKEMKIGEKRKV